MWMKVNSNYYWSISLFIYFFYVFKLFYFTIYIQSLRKIFWSWKQTKERGNDTGPQSSFYVERQRWITVYFVGNLITCRYSFLVFCSQAPRYGRSSSWKGSIIHEWTQLWCHSSRHWGEAFCAHCTGCGTSHAWRYYEWNYGQSIALGFVLNRFHSSFY